MYSITGSLGMETIPYWLCVLLWAAAYMVGNISPSILIGRARGIDIRKEGSGNPGTTNTLRVMGKGPALAVLLIDILKGTVVVVLAGILFGETMAEACTLFVFLGHIFPVCFGFKGGKGVATAFGALAGLYPALGFSLLGIVVLAVLISRRVSVGSIAGAIACPILAYFMIPDFTYLAAVMGLIVLVRHSSNIGRLIRREEPPLSFGKKKKDEEGKEE